MESILLTSTISRSLPTKLVLGVGQIVPAGNGRFHPGGTGGGAGGSLPAAISSRRRRVAAPGCVPNSSTRALRSRSYCARARSGRPDRA